MKPRILHIIKTLELGGAETNLRNLVQAFDKNKFEHHVAYSYGGVLEKDFTKDPEVRTYRFAKGAHKIASFATLVIIARLWFYILSRRIRIVHTHNFNAHFWGVFAAKLAGARVVEHVHDFRYFDIEDLRRRKGSDTLNRHIGKFKGLSDRVVVLTEQNRRFLVEGRSYRQDQVRIIPNGIPLGTVPAIAKGSVTQEFGLNPEDPVILIASRMAPTKNVELLLTIAPQVLKELPRAVFLIAGDGEGAASFRAEVKAKGLEKSLRCIGYYADIPRLLSASDAFLLPSFLELHSISILEALSAGVPVVASSDVGCNSDVLTDGKDAFLLDPFSTQGWGDALIRLLKDPALRKTVGQNGLRLCREKFDIRAVVKKFEELYSELLGGTAC